MVTCGTKGIFTSVLVLVFGCLTPVKITDPKLIEIERFINACAADDIKLVEKMLKFGMDVNAQDYEFHSTCLHHAAYRGSLQMVELLLKNGASVTLRDKQGRTPLFDSIFVPRNRKPASWNKKVVKFLLTNGADKTINQKSATIGGTPLYWACRLHEPEIVKLLLDYGADPNYEDNGRFWAYHCVQRRLEGHEEEQRKARDIWVLLKGKGAKEPI